MIGCLSTLLGYWPGKIHQLPNNVRRRCVNQSVSGIIKTKKKDGLSKILYLFCVQWFFCFGFCSDNLVILLCWILEYWRFDVRLPGRVSFTLAKLALKKLIITDLNLIGNFHGNFTVENVTVLGRCQINTLIALKL